MQKFCGGAGGIMLSFCARYLDRLYTGSAVDTTDGLFKPSRLTISQNYADQMHNVTFLYVMAISLLLICIVEFQR